MTNQVSEYDIRALVKIARLLENVQVNELTELLDRVIAALELPDCTDPVCADVEKVMDLVKHFGDLRSVNGDSIRVGIFEESVEMKLLEDIRSLLTAPVDPPTPDGKDDLHELVTGVIWECRGTCINDSASETATKVLAAIREHGTAGVRERCAEAVINGVNWNGGTDWADPTRIPEGDDPEDWSGDYVCWDYCNDEWREHGYQIADAVLAALGREG